LCDGASYGYFRDNIEKMKGYEPGFQPKSTDVIKLNTNENPYRHPCVLKVIMDIKPENLRRYPDPKRMFFESGGKNQRRGAGLDYELQRRR